MTRAHVSGGSALIASLVMACANAQPPDPHSARRIEIGVDAATALCFVGDSHMDCGSVGLYLRNILRIPVADDIHILINRNANWDETERLLAAVQEAGYKTIGFVTDAPSR